MEPHDRCLLIRADAGPRIGLGHGMRCLALGQAWQEAGGRAVFATAPGSPALEARLRFEGMGVVGLAEPPGSEEDAARTADLARQAEAAWVVVDGYHFGAGYQRALRDAGHRLLFIDDNGHAGHYPADVVLNQNLHAHEGLYASREPHTRLLLGTRHALLRREFATWRGRRRALRPAACRVLVTLGGGDPDNVSLRVVQSLQQLVVEGLESIVVVGGSNPHRGELLASVRDSHPALRLESDAANMPDLMAWADVAVAGAGSTAWELAFMGLPSLLLVLADNQRLIAERLAAAGVAVSLGWHEGVSPAEIAAALAKLLTAADARGEMARRGQEMVDGLGAARVVAALANPSGGSRADPVSGE